ncbi:protein SET DOMAIN GROUP 41-like [Chenopodium quinoa]|uniref:protein SET DOMAIN GROUP 41-like n=1 Tax=Chenopodium quinoa TaxID=63459 RepID=UPI000B78F360|nr:protein SET DOMAIN GROUP 41-like [Chenopodium quinoa]
MEMRAKENIPISQDITPPLPPLAFSLYNSSLSSHCSSCSLPLPATAKSETFIQYCSNGGCSSTIDASLHYSSGEHHLFSLLHSNPSLFPHSDSSDLRLSLRLLHLLPSHSPPLSPRFLGLLTNRDKFDSDERDLSRVRVGARVMAMARAMRNDRDSEFESDFDCELEEAVLCLVITNAVEINFNGVRVGIGVYDCCFSWINHSCSPNSCFWFVPVSEEGFNGGSLLSSAAMRIFPCGDAAHMEDRGDSTACNLAKGDGNYGPRIIVRSIKGIQRGEEVTITYTDLLRPTALRQSELLLEYKFLCSCKRCSAIPHDYVDHALQEMFCANFTKSCSKTPDNDYKDQAIELLSDVLDSTIEEYMEVGDPVSCCEKLEGLFSEGLLNQHFEQTKGDFAIDVKLSPFHYLSLNAYTTLISTYKMRANLSGKMDHLSIDMSRTSAAYSLLLAGATHHLFLSEPSLIASAATFWIDAGQSLLSIGCPYWNSFANGKLQNLSAAPDVNCPGCSLMDNFKSHYIFTQTQNKFFDDMTQEFHKCTSIITTQVWSFLIQGCKNLKDVKDPIDFSWIQVKRNFEYTRSQQAEFNLCHGSENISKCVSGNESMDVRTATFQLGVHCLLYGGFLLSICYGHSYSTQLIRNVIHI